MKPFKEHLKERVPSIPREYEEEILQEICEAVNQWLKQHDNECTDKRCFMQHSIEHLLEELEK